MGRTIRTIALMAIVVWAGGCVGTSSQLPLGQDAITEELVWPAPPSRPRIRFVRVVAGPGDLGIQPSLWKRFGDFFAGRGEDSFIRPAAVAASGGIIFVADPGAQALWIIDTRSKRFLRVEEVGGERLVSPIEVTPGRGDRVYLADSYLAKVFVLSLDGKLKKTIASEAVRRPVGLAYDPVRDRLYVADSSSHCVWIFTGDGKQIGAIGQRGTGDGEFNFPTRLAVDGEGDLYVTDSLGFRLEIFSSDGTFAGKFGRHGDTSGDFAMPKGVAVDSEGHIYVVETLFDAVQIFDRRGRYLLTFGERGVDAGQFWLPASIFIDPLDRIYVADAYNQRIQIFQYLAGEGDG